MVSVVTILQEMAAGSAALIDVRAHEEWDDSHVPGAIHFPMSRLEEGTLPDVQRIYIHCRSGGRAKKAAAYLSKFHPDVIAVNWNPTHFLK